MTTAAAMARVGVAVREARKRKGMTLRALSVAIGTSVPFVCDVEHGRRFTTKLRAIEVALGMRSGTLAELAGVCKHCGGSGTVSSSTKEHHNAG